MKILYGVQGTGHGHISRARTFLPLFKQYADVDVLISGYGYDTGILQNIVYEKRGMSFVYDKEGKVSLLETARHLRPLTFWLDIYNLPVEQYDLVISDFEPITAWAARQKGIRCLAMSHQAAFLSEYTPRAAGYDAALAEPFLQYFAPTDDAVGFHYRRYDDFIEPPLIRDDIRNLTPEKGDHYTVYLPAYGVDNVYRMLNRTGVKIWHVFSSEIEQLEWRGNIMLHPVDNHFFLESIGSADGVVTHAGFETTSEAMFLNKKLFVLPIARQYEQLCNLEALKELGAWSAPALRGRSTEYLRQWIKSGAYLSLSEVADPTKIARKIIEKSYQRVPLSA